MVFMIKIYIETGTCKIPVFHIEIYFRLLNSPTK